ncbi:MAG: hypothetical protein NTV50_10000 [Planctomycetota bacterium]|nr:hypothetical protein [Planctomycetota bacterium]
MAMLFRMILIVGFLQVASGCTNFGQAKMQRVQMPVANDNRSVSLDDENKDPTKVLAKAELVTKRTTATKTKDSDSPKEQKALKVQDLPPALKLLSIKSEKDAKDKLAASKPKPLSIPPPPDPEPEKELAKKEKTEGEPIANKESEPLVLISEKPIFEKPTEAKGPTLEAKEPNSDVAKTQVEEKKPPEPKLIPEVLTLNPVHPIRKWSNSF